MKKIGIILLIFAVVCGLSLACVDSAHAVSKKQLVKKYNKQGFQLIKLQTKEDQYKKLMRKYDKKIHELNKAKDALYQNYPNWWLNYGESYNSYLSWREKYSDFVGDGAYKKYKSYWKLSDKYKKKYVYYAKRKIKLWEKHIRLYQKIRYGY